MIYPFQFCLLKQILISSFSAKHPPILRSGSHTLSILNGEIDDKKKNQ